MSRTVGRASTLTLRVIREPGYVPMTPRLREICVSYGIPHREAPHEIVDGLRLDLAPGTITLLTGPSGSGKTSILASIAEEAPTAISVDRGRFPANRPIVDAIAPRKPIAAALEILTACGLGEPRLWIRSFDDLSDGEKSRASLARAIGGSLSDHTTPIILCDEFAAILHRRAAKAVAYNLRKLVSRHRLILVAATTHEDLTADLQPDQILRLTDSDARLETASHENKRITLQRKATIEPGRLSDYQRFSPMHYRHRDNLGFVDKVFLLRESSGADPLGILVFAHAPLELSLRNQATNGRFVRNHRRLNRELRILRRLVMHPDIRGCGLGHWFVRQTLPRVGVRFVECLAVMGAVNPIFERAGMTRVGRCPVPRGRMALLERMRKLRLDPFDAEFSRNVSRHPRVRRLVEQTIHDYVDATQGAAKYRVENRRPDELVRAFRQLLGDPPVYYLWDREQEFPMDRASDQSTKNMRNCWKSDCEPKRTERGICNERDRHRPERDNGSTKA